LTRSAASAKSSRRRLSGHCSKIEPWLLGLTEQRSPTALPLLSVHAPHPYTTDPVSYCSQVLRLSLTVEQAVIASALLEPPYRIIVNSGHSVGKTFLAAALVNWWYDTFPAGVCITTAPTERDVVDLLWSEIRLQRQRAGLSLDFIGPRAPEMRTSEEHYAKGYTARRGESFQGRHREHMLFIFDECEGVEANYWTTAKTMFQARAGHAWLCIGNPTTTTSQAALEENSVDAAGNPSWRIMNLSALDHPNIAAELGGRAPTIPGAVRLTQVEQWLSDWCEPIAGDVVETDFEFPPGSGKWHRPGPIAEARMLGRRPSAGVYGVWPSTLFDRALRGGLQPDVRRLPQIGADIARKGDDWSCYHVRWGSCSVHHESHNGWDTIRNAGQLRELAEEWAGRAAQARDPNAVPVRPGEIPIRVDDDGVGGGVVDLLASWGLNVLAVNAGRAPDRPDDYPNVRSELWFALADRARAGALDLSRLPADVRRRLRQQALTPEWKLDAAGRRVVEPKEKTKEKLGRSPDDIDALNLAYYEGGTFEDVGKVEFGGSKRRGLYGR
jgi:hypothetical protein